MAEEKKETQGGLTQEQVVALIQKTNKETIAELLKPFGEQLGMLAQNQKALADTYAADKTAAEKAAEAAAKKTGDAGTPATITADDVKKIVTEAISSTSQQQQQTTERQAARSAFVADPKNGIAKLPKSMLGKLGDDPAKWADEAKQLVGEWEGFAKENKIVIPDVGGGARDGGNSPGDAANAGEANKKPGSWIKMPA